MKKILILGFMFIFSIFMFNVVSFKTFAYSVTTESTLYALQFDETYESGLSTFGEHTWTVTIDTSTYVTTDPTLFYGQIGIYLPHATFLDGYYPNITVSIENGTIYPTMGDYNLSIERGFDDNFLLLIDLSPLKLYNISGNTYDTVTIDILFHLTEEVLLISEINQLYVADFRLYANDIALDDYSGDNATYSLSLDTGSTYDGTLTSSQFNQRSGSNFFGTLKAYHEINDAYYEGYYDGGGAVYDTGYNNGQYDLWHSGSTANGYPVLQSFDYKEGVDTTVNDGINNFNNGFDRWIVPAILIVMFVGGFFSLKRMKQSQGD